MIARWPSGEQAGVSPAHCAQFIAVAKVAFGDDWKARLDPSDNTCATEVQEAWEQQRISREMATDLTPQPVVTAPAQPVQTSTETSAVRTPRAETYCLNVISLAKAKYGADWIAKLDPAERQACEDRLPPPAQ
jgi:hypothetical protein